VTSLIIDAKGPSNSVFTLPVSRTSAALEGDVLYFATQVHALLFAVDRRTGKVIDYIQLNSHPLAIISTSPTVVDGIIYTGYSSLEEAAAGLTPNYICCSFVGNFAAVTLKSGHLSILWNQAMAPENSGFSGVGVWGSQPSVDKNRQQVFIATGNIYNLPKSAQDCASQAQKTPGLHRDPCTPATVYAESILAFDLTTGLINWVAHFSPLDAWNAACVAGFGTTPANCPPNPGPDADFGMAPTFVPGSAHTPHGRDTVVIGQKNGNLYALSAQDGTLFWVLPTSPDGITGGLIWGIAVDDTSIYYTAVNTGQKSWKLQASSINITNSAFGAASLSNGKILWETQVPKNMSSQAAPTIANDVVFTGRTGSRGTGLAGYTGGGGLIALNKNTGAILHDYGFNDTFYANIAIVDNYIMFGDGYASKPGNGGFNVWKAK